MNLFMVFPFFKGEVSEVMPHACLSACVRFSGGEREGKGKGEGSGETAALLKPA
jgi:hypothetical protein